MRDHWLVILLALHTVLLAPTGHAQASTLTAEANAAAGSDAAAAPDAAPSQGASESGSSKSPLQGIVEHSEEFAPVAPELRTGAKFDEASLPKVIPGNSWYPIPEWMAGTWQFKTETVTYMRTFVKQHYPKVPFVLRNEFQKTLGLQRDKSGQIWDYLKAPYSYTAKLNDGLLGYVTDNVIEVVRDNENELVRKLVGPDSVVDPDTQQILLTNQKECFTRYTKFGDDAVHVDGSTKIFDMNGKPTVLKFSNMLALRVKPFEIVDQKDGQNLKQMFSDFLRSQGKADLIP